MNSDKKMICKNFESEIWLLLDEGLPGKKIEFWRDHISGCETCKNLLEQTEGILSVAEHDTHDIDDNKFNYMIERATAKSGFSLNEFFTFFSIRSLKSSMIYRAALAGALAIAVIFISPAIRERNTDKIVSNDLLDWDGTKINRELNMLREEVFAVNQDSWSREIDYIDSRIDVIKQGINPDLF